jgi:hypothetical protein
MALAETLSAERAATHGLLPLKAAMLAIGRFRLETEDLETAMFRAVVLSVFALTAVSAGNAQAASPSADADKAICQKILDRYQALLKSDPKAPFRKSDYAASPLDVLAQAKSSGVMIEPDAVIANFAKDPHRALTEWAQRQKPPIEVPKDVEDEIAQLAVPGAALHIDQLPEAGLYRVKTIQGTAFCPASKYFQVKGARARLATGPGIWDEENGGGCGVARNFGKIDDTPVALQDNYSQGDAEFGSDTTVAAWDGEKFTPSCTIHFEFAPLFLPKSTFNQWDESCAGIHCKALRLAALDVAEVAEAYSAVAKKRLVSKLTATQRADFAAILKLLHAEDIDADVGRFDIIDRGPLLLPLVADKNLYLARAGRVTIGWRVFSDWSVVVERRDKDKMVAVAQFAIGVTKGKLLKAEVIKAEKP